MMSFERHLYVKKLIFSIYHDFFTLLIKICMDFRLQFTKE